MESWDHPMKFPYYIFPDYCLTWNIDLSHDTKGIQNLNKVRRISPLKFNYIYEFKDQDDDLLFHRIDNEAFKSEIEFLENKKIVLYPTTTSSANIMHDGEMKLIGELCDVFEGSEYYFYI